jgi:cell division protein FtsB
MLRGRLFLITVIIMLAVVVYQTTWSRRGLKDLLILRRQEIQLHVRCEHLRNENTVLATQVEQLRFDDEYLQSLIRRELGLIAPGELIYRFSSKPRAPEH